MEDSLNAKEETKVEDAMESTKNVEEETKIEAMEGVPSRSKDLSKTLSEDAFNQFLQGKRHMLVQDYTSAVHSLTAACEMYTSHFGELAIECAEVHFLYGKALFRLSQQQAGILGGALNEEVTEDDEDDDDEDGEQEQGDENKENGSEKKESDAENGEENEENATEEKEPSESTDSPQGEPVEEKETPPKDETAAPEGATAEGGDPADKTLEESQLEPEADDDLELAWNSLETSKSIFLRQGPDNVEAQLKVAEIMQLLAEISMESDNNAAAIADLKESLAIKERHLAADDRLLAETFYQMGLALMLDKQYPEALEHFSRTEEILTLHITNLEKTPLPQGEEEAGSWAAADRQKEIEDLQGVIADIKEKAEDTRELIRSTKKDVEEAILANAKREKEAEIGFTKVEPAQSTSKPVSNITHLLKRKKPEEEGKESDSKRLKIAQNGDTKKATE